jgi:hypothetical protein
MKWYNKLVIDIQEPEKIFFFFFYLWRGIKRRTNNLNNELKYFVK